MRNGWSAWLGGCWILGFFAFAACSSGDDVDAGDVVDSPDVPEDDGDTGDVPDVTDGEDEADGAGPSYGCVRDEMLLAADFDCRRDDDCPCGAHCVLGRCAADCANDGDCTAGTCDEFGRCRTDDAPPFLGLLSREVRGRLQVEPASVELYSAASERKVRLRALGTDVATARVVVDDGLEVRCAPDEPFRTECTLGAIAAANPTATELTVRPRGTFPAATDALGALRIFDGAGVRVVPVRRVAAGLSPDAARPAGVYEGHLQLLGAGLASRSTIPDLPGELAELRLPVTIRVFPSTTRERTVEVVDGWPGAADGVLRPLGALFPGDVAVGRLYLDTGGAWHLELTTDQPFLRESATDRIGMDVGVSAVSETAAWQGERLDAMLRTRYAGATLTAHDPVVRWRLNARWVRALTAGETEPTRPTGYVPGTPATTATTDLPGEGTVLSGPLPALTAGTPEGRTGQVVCSQAGALRDLVAQVQTDTTGRRSPSGDLGCGTLAREPQRTFLALNAGGHRMNDVVAWCVDDLRLGTGTATGTCLDRGRLFEALDQAGRPSRCRALGDAACSGVNRTADALFQRLLQQWVALHAFLGREAGRLDALNDVAPRTGDAPRVSSFAALQAGLQGWNLLLHPRVAVVLPFLDGEALGAPDYRVRLFPTFDGSASRTAEIGVGLPAGILQALARQADGIAVFLQRAGTGASFGVSRAQLEELVRNYLRRTLVVTALAQGLHEASIPYPPAAWENDWLGAADGLATSVQGLLEAFDRWRAGTNPLGIEDGDLPIYSAGDQTTARSRFAALSTYLAGSASPPPLGVAQTLVDRASTALDAVRDSWQANAERDLWADILETEQVLRIEGAQQRYGDAVCALCGGDCEPGTVLEADEPPNAETCYVVDGCRIPLDDVYARLGTADLGYQLCLVAELRRRLGPDASTGSYATDAMLDRLNELASTTYDAHFGFDLVQDAALGGWEVLVMGEELELPDDPVRFQLGYPASLEPALVVEVRNLCESARQATLDARPGLVPASCVDTDDCPVGYFCTGPGTCAPTEDETRPECYQGALGEAALGLLQTARQVDIARSQLQELSDAYDIGMRSCIIQRLGAAAQLAAMDAHAQTMNALGEARAAAAKAEAVAAAAKDCSSIGKVLGCGGAVVEAGAKVAGIELDRQMEEAERQHELVMARIAAETADQVCFNDAEMNLVGTRTAALEIQRAALELSAQVLAFENLRRDVEGLWSAGRETVTRERDRRVSPLQVDFWLDANLEQFQDAMRRARRAVYLAVLAAEYEFQFSSAGRAATLDARTPLQLQDVLDDLRSLTGTGTVGGAAPENRLAVVSLRDHLLQLADHSTLPDGWHTLSDGERFRLWLTSPVHAVYDETGRYRGQRIPFAIGPLGSTNLGETHDIPLLTGYDCAERLWSVNASISGTDVHRGAGTWTDVHLRQRNSFYSQWCVPPADGSDYADASTRPSRNLFRDPYSPSTTVPTAVPAPQFGDEVNDFTVARISARFNRSRAELESESYVEGDSQELAARALYGDYELFFPADFLSIGSGDGLVLANVEDVLLRFEYVSVARSD